MLIEQTTTYAYKLKYLDNPTFDKVRDFAKKFIDDLPKELVDGLYEEINRGVDQLTTEPQMLVYLYSFGNMHQAKLNVAFTNISEVFFGQPKINIIDYGCGQGIGTMCYADFLSQKGITQNIKSVTLIEPSEISLKRAALHVSNFFPNAEISTINKTFDELSDEDINCEEDIPTLHIMSNVLDLLDFDLERFAELINDRMKGYNQFVCVGPYFGFQEKDKRMKDLYLLLNGDENFSKFYEKYELSVNKAWTAQIRCFSVGELEENLSTEATWENIRNGVEDLFGVVYSRDGKRLLKYNNDDEKYDELSTYSIKERAKVICNGAFSICKSLQQITMPNSVINIGECAFEYCRSLQHITIPNSVRNIGKQCFKNCVSLNQLIIPKSVKNIGSAVFAGCVNLNVISKSSRFIVTNKMLIDNSLNCIISYFGTDISLSIPNSITSIGDRAFYDCVSLQQITIPDSVTSIGVEAFGGCSSLQQITIPDSVTSIAAGAFWRCSSLQQITIPVLVTSIGARTFMECSSLQQITIPNSVTKIGCEAFAKCKSLQQITIPNSITCIEYGTFMLCSSLQKVIIPKSVINIEQHAFQCCISLQKCFIPNSVTSIGDNVFFGCESLQQIKISDSVTNIGEGAFCECKMLEKVTISNSVTRIRKDTFLRCTSMKKIIIPNSVTMIGEGAFACCYSLQKVYMPKSLLSIGIYAFQWCECLQQITIPNSVTMIGEYAFKMCTSLFQVVILNPATEIGEDVFRRCDSLQQIIISEDCVEKFKQMFPIVLWDKLYYLKKVV